MSKRRKYSKTRKKARLSSHTYNTGDSQESSVTKNVNSSPVYAKLPIILTIVTLVVTVVYGNIGIIYQFIDVYFSNKNVTQNKNDNQIQFDADVFNEGESYEATLNIEGESVRETNEYQFQQYIERAIQRVNEQRKQHDSIESDLKVDTRIEQLKQAGYHHTLGHNAAVSENYQEAIRQYSLSNEIDPHPSTYSSLALVYVDLRQSSEAINCIKESYKLSQQFPLDIQVSVLANYIAVCNEFDVSRIAIDLIESIEDTELISRLKENWVVVSNLGIAYSRTGQPLIALEMYDKSELLMTEQELSSNYNLPFNRAVAYKKLEDTDSSLKYLLESRTMFSKLNSEESYKAYVLFGNLYVQNEDYDTALEFYDRALDRIENEGLTTLPGVYANVANALKNKGELDEATSVLEKAIKLEAELGLQPHPGYVMNMGMIEYEKGHYLNALEYLESAEDLCEYSNPEILPKVLYNKMAAYLKLRNYEEAKKMGRKTIAVCQDRNIHIPKDIKKELLRILELLEEK